MSNNYSFKNDLFKSIKIAQESEGKYTYIFNPLFPEGIKIYISNASIEWVLRYKKNRLNDFLAQKKLLKIDIQDHLFLFIYYFYAFICNDVWHLYKYIPQKINNILNIGAGIGLFELYLNYVNKKIKNFTIIEKNNLDHNNELINVLDMAKETIFANNLEGKFSFYDDLDFNNIYDKFDLILSFRSWCYKYDIDVYLDFVMKCITINSVIIIDIRKKYEYSKITKRFYNSQVITSYPDHNRYLLKNFKG